MTKGRSGRPWERIKKQIRANTTNCWRCGKALDPQVSWRHPLFVTIGHIVALEDCEAMGIDPEEPTNLAGECQACNSADGARRTNRKRHPTYPTPNQTKWINPNW